MKVKKIEVADLELIEVDRGTNVGSFAAACAEIGRVVAGDWACSERPPQVVIAVTDREAWTAGLTAAGFQVFDTTPHVQGRYGDVEIVHSVSDHDSVFWIEHEAPSGATP